MTATAYILILFGVLLLFAACLGFGYFLGFLLDQDRPSLSLPRRRKVEKWSGNPLEVALDVLHVHALEKDVLDRPISDDVVQGEIRALSEVGPFHGSGTIEGTCPAPEIPPTKPKPQGRLLTPEQVQQEQADTFFAQRSPEVLTALRCFNTLGKPNVFRGSVWECPCHGDRWVARYGWNKPWYDFFHESRDQVYITSIWQEPGYVSKRTVEWKKLKPGEYPTS